MSRLRRLVLLSLIATWIAGCTGSGKPAPGVLRVQVATEPVTLDPTLAEDGASMRVLANTWSGLVAYDGAGQLVNRLADTIAVSEDGLRYTISIKPGARWSDNTPVTAEHFVLGLTRALKKETAAKLAPMLFPIKGAETYHLGRATELAGVHGSDRTLTIELDHPAPYFRKALALSIALPLREDVLVSNKGRWPFDGPTTGPYRVSAYERGQKIVLQRNGDPIAGRVNTVEMRIVADESSSLNLFDRGQLDILTRVPALEMERLKKEGVVRIDPFVATYYIAFNTRKPPFDRVPWRKAIAASIRRAEITKVLATGETPARSWLPPGIEGFLPWDPEADEGKVSSGLKADLSHSKPVEAAFDSSARNSLIMEKVQHDIEQGAGLRTQLTNQDWKAYIRRLQTDPPAIYRFAWLAPFLDPVPHLQVFTTGNPNGYTGWSNKRYDALVAEIERLAPGEERTRKILAAQKILLQDEVPVVPLFHYVQSHAVSKRVVGFRVNAFGAIPFDELTLEEAK